jgi:hypothetical protein
MQMQMSLFVIGVLILSLTSCNWGAPPGERRGPVQQLPGGEFMVHFKRDAVDQPGVDRLVAVKNYMLKNKLIPDQCPGDIKILSSGDSQNGNGHALFVCIYQSQN